MADPQTGNRNYNVPITGSDVGTWGDVLNGNFDKIDRNLGNSTVVPLSSTNVTLTSGTVENGTIIFTGAVVGSVTVTFPTVRGWWTLGNLTTGVGTFLVASGGTQVISIPPGEFVQICIDSFQNPQFVNLGRVGSYLDLATTSTPTWITNCTIPPYLNCIGGTFNASIYPILANILGGNALPDFRGRGRYYLNQTTGRITSAVSGVNGDVLFASGGSESLQAHSHNGGGTTQVESQLHVHSGVAISSSATSTPGGNFSAVGSIVFGNTSIESQQHTHDFSFTTGNSGAGASQNMPPATIGGITLIRAA